MSADRASHDGQSDCESRLRWLLLKGLFVTSRGFLDDRAGGVQVCTREFLDCLGAAGISLKVLPVDGDRSWPARLKRLFNSSPFLASYDPAVPGEVRTLATAEPFDFVFLNQEFLAPLAAKIRPYLAASCKVVVLSHGLEIVDMLHAVRLGRHLPLERRWRPSPAVVLGSTLLAEQRLREDVDIVCAISPFGAEMEHWLGTRRVGWLPRTIAAVPLAWRPVRGRFGFVGTLDHGPSLDGLVQVLEAFGKDRDEAAHVRIVGSPARLGGWLEKRFPFVSFLGSLDDPSLEAEAATWNAFLHPIFCLPRGCSTKLAQAIGWQIPIVTTAPGRRGYVWKDGNLLEADDADHFARLCRALIDDRVSSDVKGEVAKVAATSPSMTDVAAIMADLLEIGAG